MKRKMHPTLLSLFLAGLVRDEEGGNCLLLNTFQGFFQMKLTDYDRTWQTDLGYWGKSAVQPLGERFL